MFFLSKLDIKKRVNNSYLILKKNDDYKAIDTVRNVKSELIISEMVSMGYREVKKLKGDSEKSAIDNYLKSLEKEYAEKPIDPLRLANEIILELKRDNARYVKEMARMKKENAHLHKQMSQSLFPLS